jgi:ligand-binding sensor domain-containing protein
MEASMGMTKRDFRRSGVWRLPLLVALAAGGCALRLDAAEGAAAPASARPLAILCQRISLAQGLSQSTVRGIVQDRRGFIWIATEGGLNRYDGQQILTFKRDAQDPDSLGHNILRALCLGPDGALWIGMESGGMDRFDPGTGRFTHFRHRPGNPASLSQDFVQAFCVGRDGTLWAGTDEGGLNRLDPARGTFASYRHDPNRSGSLSHDCVTSILEDAAGTLWVGTMRGLNRLDRASGRFQVFRHDSGDASTLVNDQVLSLAEGKPGEIWIGTEAGLCRFDTSTGRSQACRYPGVMPGHVPFLLVRTLLRDRAGRLWVGTWDGLLLADPATGECREVQVMVPGEGAPQSEEILSLREDQTGVIWIGTSFGGVLRYNPESEQFTSHQLPSSRDTTSRANIISALGAQADGTVWIGSAGDNVLHRLPPGEVDAVPVEMPLSQEGLGASPIYAIHQSRREPEILWLGTAGGGLLRYDLRTGRASPFGSGPRQRGSLSGRFVWAVLEDSGGTLWAGSLGGGLSRWRPETGEFETYLHDPGDPHSLGHDTVLCIYEAPSWPGVLWIGTAGGGLNRFDPRTGRFERYQNRPGDPGSLSDDSVAAVLESPEWPGILWVGTNDGFLRFEPGSGRFTQYGTAEGLADTAIAGIQADRRGYLWMGTLKGISRFDPRTGSFLNYDYRDGLRIREFNRAASCRTPDGRLYFGGINGFATGPRRRWFSPPCGCSTGRSASRARRPASGRSPWRTTRTFSPSSSPLWTSGCPKKTGLHSAWRDWTAIGWTAGIETRPAIRTCRPGITCSGCAPPTATASGTSPAPRCGSSSLRHSGRPGGSVWRP